MTAREKAIEAAAAAMEPNIGFEKLKPGYQHELRNRAALAAPHIESALLDRIEDAVKRLLMTSGPDVGDRGTYGTIYALDAVLAILTEIRDEGAWPMKPLAPVTENKK